MKKRKSAPVVVPAPKVRNAFALHASKRPAVVMKDRRAPRGGAKNIQRDHKDEE